MACPLRCCRPRPPGNAALPCRGFTALLVRFEDRGILKLFLGSCGPRGGLLRPLIGPSARWATRRTAWSLWKNFATLLVWQFFLFSLFRPPARRTMREKSLPCEKESYRPFPKAKLFPIPCLRAAHCRPPRRQPLSSIYLLRMYSCTSSLPYPRTAAR